MQSDPFTYLKTSLNQYLQQVEDTTENELQKEELARLYLDRAHNLNPYGVSPVKLSQIAKTKQKSPRRILLYGTAGIGKSTYASTFPNPVFISTENGLRDIDAVAFPECKKAVDVYECVHELFGEEHEFETCVIDSIDWTERLMGQKICDEGGKPSLAEFGFGRGHEMLAGEMQMLLTMLTDLAAARNMHIILIAHAAIQKFTDPGVGEWDRYSPSLHKKTVEAVKEWATEIFFTGYRAYTNTEEGAFGKKTTTATGVGERFLRTQERPTQVAKSRLDLPYEIPMDLSQFNILDPENKPVSVKEAEEVF